MRKLAHTALAGMLAITMAFAGSIASSEPASAGRRGIGLGLGIGLGILGAYALTRPHHAYAYDYCYAGPKVCERIPRSCWHNRYGDYVCRGGEVRCWRERICD